MNSVYNILAGILNIGNVDFIEKEDQHLPIVTIENRKLTDVGKLFSTVTVVGYNVIVLFHCLLSPKPKRKAKLR